MLFIYFLRAHIREMIVLDCRRTFILPCISFAFWVFWVWCLRSVLLLGTLDVYYILTRPLSTPKQYHSTSRWEPADAMIRIGRGNHTGRSWLILIYQPWNQAWMFWIWIASVRRRFHEKHTQFITILNIRTSRHATIIQRGPQRALPNKSVWGF